MSFNKVMTFDTGLFLASSTLNVSAEAQPTKTANEVNFIAQMK